MCGIIGGCSQRDVAPLLLAGLQHLEYRGYDSAGMAILNEGNLQRCRALGKVAKLGELLEQNPLQGAVGIAHTRWATHGEPSERNAHPHVSGTDIAVVHNGIIENHEILKMQLSQLGYEFNSETDTETVAHLLHRALGQGHSFLQAVQTVVGQLEGAFALVFLYKKMPDTLIAVRKGSPLVVGCGIGENFIASDTLALLPITQQFIHLEEGDVAEITRHETRLFDSELNPITRPICRAKADHASVTRGEYRHFMLKEIFEQPKSVLATVGDRVKDNRLNLDAFSPELLATLEKIKRIQIVACGTSYHAGLVARAWFEVEARVATQVDVASEWRYHDVLVEPDTLFIVISQSGETADALAALRLAKVRGYAVTLSICNVAESAIVRETDMHLLTFAGPEIGVASTKAFTTQLVALFLLMVLMGRQRFLSELQEEALITSLQHLPEQIDFILDRSAEIEALAKLLVHSQHALFLGRNIHYPIALEGALKLKELTYIHAEAYPAGELKHGPLALIDNNMPVIALVPQDNLVDKIKSNLQEVKARGGNLLILTHQANKESLERDGVVFVMPDTSPIVSPILYTIPLQLLAYYVAVLKGTDVDQPRNLAKSVTVE
ncbi:MAG: glutamine--fructose-6-phosphate transaminase (isomerizing) [Gammaproteobacteria bacterium]|nr:glutamine--fructose-6-phosphate transaminase (isomerizing) [Gammaproteobacteria bacterium]